MAHDPHDRTGRDLPATNEPLGGPPRKRAPAVLALVALVLVVLVAFAVITWLRYNT